MGEDETRILTQILTILVNDLPDHLKNKTSIQSFKNALYDNKI